MATFNDDILFAKGNPAFERVVACAQVQMDRIAELEAEKAHALAAVDIFKANYEARVKELEGRLEQYAKKARRWDAEARVKELEEEGKT